MKKAGREPAIRILITSKVDLRIQNATRVHLLEVTTNLRKLGYDVLLLVAGGERRDVEKGILTKRLHHIPIKYLRTISMEAFSTFAIVYYALFWRADLIYSRQESLMIAPIIASVIVRKPFVIEINGILAEEAKLFGARKPVIWLMSVIEKMAVKVAHKIITVTGKIKDYLIETYSILPNKIEVIPNGANTDLFRPMEVNINELGLDEHDHYIGFVGNLAPWQGVEYLIESAPLILEAIPDAKFLVVGDGPLRENLLRTIKDMELNDKFIFTGAVPYDQVPKYVNCICICICTKIKRNLTSGLSPLKLYEYWACEKPVVAGDISGLREAVEDSGAGILVDPERPASIANAVIKLMSDEKLRRQMGKRGREYVLKGYSWEKVAERVGKACEECCPASRSDSEK